MHGVKEKKINWKDTNVALVGSELDHKVKKAAAEGEPQWQNVGQRVELRVWRIEQFRVVPWPKAKYGKFHEGDSYIVLNTFKDPSNPTSPKLLHDVHMWIGQESSQDEYGTAAYKMVEVDEILDGAPVEHREVQGEESELFVSYFGGRLTILHGGVDTGFRHVETGTLAEPHLYRIKGKDSHIALTQVTCRRDEMNVGDVFILDNGKTLFQWNGKEASAAERMKGGEVLREMAASRGAKTVVLDDRVNDDEASGDGQQFWSHVPGEATYLGIFTRKLTVQSPQAGGEDAKVSEFVPTLYRLGARSGIRRAASARMVDVGATKALRIKRSLLDTRNVMLLDDGFHIYVWQGKESTSQMRAGAVHQVQEYLKSYKRPEGMAVTFLKEGQDRVERFNAAFYDAPPGWPCFAWCS